MEKMLIQVTAGRGPVECCRVVAKVVSLIIKEAGSKKCFAELISAENGDLPATLQSASIRVTGSAANDFARSWTGTVLWVAQSPYRPMYKRKNWFVGIQICDTPVAMQWKDSDVKFDTTRASGPGGQHVNKVETAVRATHLPSGLQVLAMDSRSQLQNRKTSLVRLKEKFEHWETQKITAVQQTQWQEHNILERGNPVKVFRERL